MKLKLESIDLKEEVWKAFAIKNGWQEKVMTVDLSPNVEVDNSQSFVDFIVNQYGNPIWADIAEFNVQESQKKADEIKAKADDELAIAQEEALNNAKEIVTLTIE